MKTRLIAVAAVAASLLLSGCDFHATASVTCTTGADGATHCTGTGDSVPAAGTTTTPAAPTTPPVTDPPTSTPVTSSPVTVPPTTAPPVTTAPPTGSPAANSAAALLNWGAPLPSSDDFNYTGAPDPAKWEAYGVGGSVGGSGSNCWEGHDGNGRRCAARNTVAGGFLRQTGLANGDTAGLASKLNQKTGAWEVRARVAAVPGATGHRYHAVLIGWPGDDRFPQGGELDFMEVNVGDPFVTAFIHRPANTVIQDEFHSAPVDLTQWHNYALLWTPSAITGYLDGVKWFTVTTPAAQPPNPMHLTIQLDDFYGAGMQAATFDVDWARIYKL